MKKYCIYLLGLLATLAASCTVVEPVEVVPAGDGYTAVIEAPAVGTRTVADANLHVLWSKNDELSIFDKSTWNGEYKLQGEGGTNTGEFTKIETSGYVAGVELPLVYAVYPYNAGNAITNEGVVSVTLPAAQTYAPNSFGPGAATMASIAVGKELKFKNMCGFFAVSLYGSAKVKSITFKGNNNEPIAGAATITGENGAIPTLTMGAAATKEITLTCTEPVQLGTTAETATIFWIAVPPTTFTQGITVTVTDDADKTFEKKTTGELNIVRNTKTETEPLKAFEETGTPMFMKFPHMMLIAGGKLGTQVVYYGSVDDFTHATEAEDFTWVSNDPAVATVTAEYGEVKGIAAGQTTIVGTNEKGETISFPVKVVSMPEKNYADYVPGISLFDCRNGDLPWNKGFATYSLKEGYRSGTQCMGATISAYKVAELYFTEAVDASKIQNPALFLRVYISDPSKLTTVNSGDQPYVEIRSTGKVWKPGMESFPYVEDPKTFWRLKDIFANWDDAQPSAKQTLVAGWNNIVLPVSKAFRKECDLSAITYFRIFQASGQTYNEVEWRFDEIRIIDWTEVNNCDNFAMWHVKPIGENVPAYVDEGDGSVGASHLFLGSQDGFRLEMWDGLEYAIPAMFDATDLKLQLNFKCDDPAFFSQHMYYEVEFASAFTPDNNNYELTIGTSTDRPVELQTGWNTLSFNFSDGNKIGNFNPRKVTYIRFLLVPDWTGHMHEAPRIGYHSYRFDNIRVVEK